MAKSNYDFDIIIIGSGAAGSVAAESVARIHKKVAIVESSYLGGSAPNISDIPLGTLLNIAHVFSAARNSKNFGLRTNAFGYNYPSIKSWKDLVVRRSGASSTGEYLESRGIKVFRGRAHFIGKNEISIGRRHLSADKFIIATGSQQSIPVIHGLSEVDFLTPETAINLLKPPKSLAIIGAGATGVQFAELFATFGTKVHLFDIKKRILSRMDDEISHALADIFTHSRGMEIHTSSKIISMRIDKPSIQIKFFQGEIGKSVKVEKILVATGQIPNVDIGLENANVEYDQSGIRVNENLVTSARNIFAAGDVLGKCNTTQSAIYEAHIAAHNATKREKRIANYQAMPHVVWTNPEIATVGATESDLIREDIKFHSSIAQNSAVSRANVANFTTGFTKILTDQKGVLLGATVMSPHAAEIIGEFGIAIKNNMTAFQIADTIHPFGSWSEVARLACAKIRA